MTTDDVTRYNDQWKGHVPVHHDATTLYIVHDVIHTYPVNQSEQNYRPTQRHFLASESKVHMEPNGSDCSVRGKKHSTIFKIIFPAIACLCFKLSQITCSARFSST